MVTIQFEAIEHSHLTRHKTCKVNVMEILTEYDRVSRPLLSCKKPPTFGALMKELLIEFDHVTSCAITI